MGTDHGWDAATFRKKSAREDGTGRIVENMCLGCDAYFEEHLGAQLQDLQEARRAKRSSRPAPKQKGKARTRLI